MSKTSAVKPPNIPVVNETKATPSTSLKDSFPVPSLDCIAWAEIVNHGFCAFRFTLKDGKVEGEVVNLTPEGPKPRHHVADTLKVALVNGLINPVGGQ